MACNSKSDPNEQINKELLAISTFLDTYKTTHPNDVIVYDAYGESIVVQTLGSGLLPHTGQKVKVTYTARLFPDNTVFDQGVINDKIDNITIDGLKVGVSYLMQGSEATIYIPSQNGFGSAGSTNPAFLTPVPPNTTIVYQVKLDTVMRTTDERTQFLKDSTAIQAYFETNNITNVVYHPAGLWYSTDNAGGGQPQPNVYDKVDVTVKGLLIADGKTFQQEAPLQGYYILSLIDGFKIALPLLKKGDAAVLYLPSGLGYGTTEKKGVPANSSLLFNVKITDVYSN